MATINTVMITKAKGDLLDPTRVTAGLIKAGLLADGDTVSTNGHELEVRDYGGAPCDYMEIIHTTLVPKDY